MGLLDGMSKLDKFEKFGQTMYLVQLLFVPKFWLSDNLADQRASEDPHMLFLCGNMACLIFAIWGFSLVLRTGKTTLKKAIFLQS